MKPSRPVRLRFQIIVFSLSRTILNTGFRMVYPFLPAIARGLGVEIETITLAITARSGLGLAGPVIGLAADRLGRKSTMILGLSIFSLGLLLVTIWPTYFVLTLGLLLGAAGKILFDPAMQAYLGERVDYRRRSLAIATTEMGWSGASLIGLPLIGWIISRAGWVAPFPLLAGLALAFVGILWFILPIDRVALADRPTLFQALQRIFSYPSALASLGIGLLLSTSNEIVNIIYGVWMEEAFALRVTALGATAAVIGLAELGGEGTVAAITDRIGKRRAIGLGTVFIALSCLTLPLLERSLAGALFGLFLFFITFEFTFVSVLSMMTELVPRARGTLMAANIAAAAGGRAMGAFVGPKLFSFGILMNCAVSAALSLVALTILILYLRVE